MREPTMLKRTLFNCLGRDTLPVVTAVKTGIGLRASLESPMT